MDHFYHSTIRKTVSAFGSLFDDIKVVKNDQITRVPLAYGPKQKFLARIQEEASLEKPRVAIKLPRLAFEITGISFDSAGKLNRMNRCVEYTNDGVKYTYSYVPYIINMQLSVLSKNEHDAQQIIEQIIPYFQPDYTVTIKEDIGGIISSTDVPIVLDGVSLENEYEGDFSTAEKNVIYNLDFTLKVRFYGPVRDGDAVIKKVIVNMLEDQDTMISRYEAEVDPITADPDDEYEIVESWDYFPDTSEFTFAVENINNSNQFSIGETIYGLESGTNAITTLVNENTVNVNNADGLFYTNEIITNGSDQWRIIGKAPLV